AAGTRPAAPSRGLGEEPKSHVLMLKDGRLVASGAPETVITAERLAEVYRVRGRVERCSQGKLQVVLDGVIAV
ncbi:hypothetical protein C9F10_14665, partial [Salmonella enterica subsp. enterica serovar Poona]